MTDEPKDVKNDPFLDKLEAAILVLLKSKNKAERLSAVGHGVKLAAIRHKISGSDTEKGFFS